MATLLLGLSAFLMVPSASAADRTTVDAYLLSVARHALTPGVYVDPAVLRAGRLTPRQIATIRRKAALQPARLHILVLPAARLTLDSGGVGPAHLAYSPREVIGRLHRVVGKPGTYALITSAPTQRGGQSFYAYQWAARNDRSYATGAAVRHAIACCAPSYGRMLLRFVSLSGIPRHHRAPGQATPGQVGPRHPHRGLGNGSFDAGGGGIGGRGAVALVVALIAVVGVGSMLVRSSNAAGGGGGDPDLSTASVADLRGPLCEEIEQVRQQIAAAGTGNRTPDPAAARIAAARQALDLAHARMTTMSQPVDAQAVTAALADARYQVAAAVAVREGRPEPAPTPPCFVDPRHGPSVTTGVYAPSGLDAAVPLCTACAASLAAGSAPAARSFLVGGLQMYPWMPYGAAWWYLNGYWGGQPFLQQLAHDDAFLAGNGEHAGHHGPDSGGGSGGGSGFGNSVGGGPGGGGHHGGGAFGGGPGGGPGGGGSGGGHGGGGGFGGGGHGGGGGGGHGH